jgi:hypothetical protein
MTWGEGLLSAAEVAQAIEADYGVAADPVPRRGGRAGVAASGDGWSLVGAPAEVLDEVGRRVAGQAPARDSAARLRIKLEIDDRSSV